MATNVVAEMEKAAAVLMVRKVFKPVILYYYSKGKRQFQVSLFTLILLYKAHPGLISSAERQHAEQLFLQFRKTKQPYEICQNILSRLNNIFIICVMFRIFLYFFLKIRLVFSFYCLSFSLLYMFSFVCAFHHIAFFFRNLHC